MNRSLLCVTFGLVLTTLHAERITLQSPDAKNEIRLDIEQTLAISVWRNGKERLKPTPINLTVENRGVLGASPKRIKQETRKIEAAITTPIYKKAAIVQKACETTVWFEGQYSVILHASNDGVAYRFATTFDAPIKVLDESAGLAFISPDQIAWVGYNFGRQKNDLLQNSWESIYQKVKVAEIEKNKKRLVYLPLVLEFDDAAMAISESDLLDYPGWNFYCDSRDTAGLRAWFAQAPVQETIEENRLHRIVNNRQPWLAETRGTRTFPWRLFMLADNAAKLTENDLVYALATPSQGDFSWVKPGLSAWEWWSAWTLRNVPFKSGINNETYRYYFDFAAENKLPYLVFDAGWSSAFDLFAVTNAIDLKALVDYGAKRNVGTILWAAWPRLFNRQEEIFKHYAALGVKGFKIDFIDRDDQVVVKYIEETARIAAKYNLVLDFHGMYKPTGIQRTWPNVLNFEGVHGLEMAKFESKTDFPANDCIVVFTRMLAGPMDYTPGAMLNETKKGFRPIRLQPCSQGTRVHQMALISLFQAPLQMLCDSVTHYRDNPECTAFMAKVPVVWDETVAIDGKIGEYAVLARRSGKVWYISAISNWEPRELKLNLGFLNGTYRAEIFADGINADRNPTDYVLQKAKIRSTEPLTIKLAPGGGWTARLTP